MAGGKFYVSIFNLAYANRLVLSFAALHWKYFEVCLIEAILLDEWVLLQDLWEDPGNTQLKFKSIRGKLPLGSKVCGL